MRLDQADRIMLGDREVSRVYLGANVAWERFFSPMGLFAQGEMGVWYDPSDFSTMFQGAAGTTPVTAVEQPVGLMLDKSRGLVLRPELVTNGDFSSGFTGYTEDGAGTKTIENGEAKLTITGAFYVNKTSATGLVAGRWYVATWKMRAFTAAGAASNRGRIQFIGPTSAIVGVEIGKNEYQLRFLASSSTLELQLGVASANAWGAAGDYAFFSNISVRELPGNHARQNTATARPIYRASPARIDFDAVDDALITTFPASLGSNCTIARAVPGVGAQILTGQTVGTTFSDTTDHAGLVIINRALTPSETTALTAYLNAKVAA